MKNVQASKRLYNSTALFKIVSILFFILLIISCGPEEQQKDNAGVPVIEFNHKEFDFGNITMGEQVSHRFLFKNIGSGDLLIDNVISTCGCTVANFDKKPITKGKESFIEVMFNSDGYRGFQKKQIEVYSNCDSSKTVLVLWASVQEPKN